MKKIALMVSLIASLSTYAQEGPVSVSVFQSKISNDNMVKVTAIYKQDNISFKINAEGAQKKSNVNLLSGSIIFQPEYDVENILLFNAEVGGYRLSQDDRHSENNVFFGIGITGLVYKDIIKIESGLYKYMGDEFKQTFNGSKSSFISIKYNVDSQFAFKIESGLKGKDIYNGIGMEYKF